MSLVNPLECVVIVCIKAFGVYTNYHILQWVYQLITPTHKANILWICSPPEEADFLITKDILFIYHRRGIYMKNPFWPSLLWEISHKCLMLMLSLRKTWSVLKWKAWRRQGRLRKVSDRIKTWLPVA
jgi:hypothetical protein